MSNHPIRIGFIGLKPDSHWAATAHIPALDSLADRFEIVGVANSNLASSQKAAKAFGIRHAFASASELAQSADIDLVVITVKVPHHFELVSLALNAGKHVYCEWPLGNGLEEARKLAQLAEEKNVVAIAGTQARFADEIQHLKTLITEGFVGKVLSTTLVGSGGQWGAEFISEYAYLSDKKNGATMQAIPLAHTLAAVREVLGDFGEMSAKFANNFDTLKLTDTGAVIPKTAPDQVMAQGFLKSGAAISIHYRGGMSRGTNLLWEINGTEGDIQVTGENGHAQMVQLKVKGARGDAVVLANILPSVESQKHHLTQVIPRNVAAIYSRIADDITNGTCTAPSFRDAVYLHEVIDRLERSAT